MLISTIRNGHVITADDDENKVTVRYDGRDIAAIRYADTHRWQVTPIPIYVAPRILEGTGWLKNEFEQLEDAIDRVIEVFGATIGHSKSWGPIVEFFAKTQD